MKHIFSFCISIKRVFILKAYIFIYELISFQKYTKTNPTYNFWIQLNFFVNLSEKKSSKKSEQSEKPSGVSRAK